MNITPATRNLTVQRGDDFAFTFDIELDADGTVSILDLTDATVLSQIREKPEPAATLIHDFNVAMNASNEITLSLTDTVTAAITKNVGYYDVLVIIGDDKTHYLKGEITFLGTVTQQEA
jgi:hypothetical protein